MLIFTLLSCKEKVVDGIEIGQDLYVGQSLKQNKKLSELITQTLNKNSNALSELTEFWCGGGAGCYDLGFVFTQIVYRIGESDFLKMAYNLNQTQKSSLKGFLDVGFEYGNYENKRTETEFPKLTEFLTEKIDISESTIIEHIEIYNLRKTLIDKQNLEVWPDLIDIRTIDKNLDSLVLFMAEINGENYLRLSKASELSKFSELKYKNDCRQEGTIDTDLKIGKVNKQNSEIEILCRTENYGILKIKN